MRLMMKNPKKRTKMMNMMVWENIMILEMVGMKEYKKLTMRMQRKEEKKKKEKKKKKEEKKRRRKKRRRKKRRSQ